MDHFNEEEKVVPTLWCSLFDKSSKTCRTCCWSISNTAGPKTPLGNIVRILAISDDLECTIKSRNELPANLRRNLEGAPARTFGQKREELADWLNDSTMDEKLLQVEPVRIGDDKCLTHRPERLSIGVPSSEQPPSREKGLREQASAC